MAKPVTWDVYTTDLGTGLLVPNPLATPTILAFVNVFHVARARPGGGTGVVNNLTGSKFGFQPTDADETARTIWVVDNGVGNFPRYVYDTISNDENQFAAVVVFDGTGGLSTSGAPTIGEYIDDSGVARTPPAVISGALAYLFAAVPSSADLAVGVSGRWDLPVGKIPTSLGFDLWDRPASTSSAPAGPPPVVTVPRTFTALAFARQLKQLLPRGDLWRLDPDSWISKTLHAVGDELARVVTRGLDLLNEADPRTATETLGDWERVLGLPDTCVVTIPVTDSARQAAITGKWVATGGQSRPYFVQVAAALGFTATVTEFWGDVLRAGFRAGDRCNSLGWVHTWRLDVTGAAALGVTFLAAPTPISAVRLATVGGTLRFDKVHNYRVAARNAQGQTLASTRVSCTPGGVTNTNINRFRWAPLAGATSYDVYAHRDNGTELHAVSLGSGINQWDDDGSVALSGALPAVTSAWLTPLPDRVLSYECTLTKMSPAHSILLFKYSNPS